MEERAFETIRLLPRRELEAFAVRAAVHIRDARREAEAGRFFSAILVGFLLGALVTSAAFLLGASLG
ncbi:hypothetical protein [Aestuariivirga sp.]|uniref:hypothetical protein n=1 Tax=Aestuariivirga sp. TaxID=2650926 RepID=UPI0025BF8B37|nr:hypothetical protein [Aestuariivirga sp.]MCA3554265.1 hypothetical protein [Aestuariivirga sp.]